MNVYSVVTGTKEEYYVLAEGIAEVPGKFLTFAKDFPDTWAEENSQILNISLEATSGNLGGNSVYKLIV